MKEFALALSAMTASHHRWPMKPPPEPAAIERPAPVQTLKFRCAKPLHTTSSYVF